MATDGSEVPEPVLAHLRRRFDIQGVLGRGGSAVVLRARHRELERPVALKLIALDGNPDELVLERAEFEGRSQSALSHPCLVEVYETERIGDHFLLVSELVEGGTLLEYLRANHPLPFRTVLERMLEIARGLEAIHAAGVVHRDLKAGNILLDERKRARITDFGLASGPGRRKKTLAGTILGTFESMAPEQVQGAACDHRTDLHALGVIGYELLAGQPPFTGSSPPELLQRILHEAPRPLAQLRPDTPTWYAQLVEGQLLAKKPEGRPADVKEVLRALERPGAAEGHKTTQPIPSGASSSRVLPAPAVPPPDPSRTRVQVRAGPGDSSPGLATVRPATSVGGAATGRPGKGSLPVIAAVILVTALVAALATGRRGISLSRLHLELKQQQGRLEAELEVPGTLVLSIVDATGHNLQPPVTAEVAGRKLRMAFTLPAATDAMRLRLSCDATWLVDLPLPRLPRFATLRNFQDLVLFSVKEGLDAWTARFQGFREDQEREVPGRRPDDRIVFDTVTFPEDWRVVCLVRLVGHGTLPPPEGTTADPVPCELVLEPEASTYTRKGLGTVLLERLKEAHREKGGALGWEEAGALIFPCGPPGSFEEASSHFGKLFDSPAVPTPEKLLNYEWLVEMHRVALGTIHQGVLAPLPLEDLYRGIVHHRTRPLRPDFEPPVARLHGFLPPEMASHRKSSPDRREEESLVRLDNIMGAEMTVITPFYSEKDGILSPVEGCPPPLRRFQDVSLWSASHTLEAPAGPWPPPGDWLTFEGNVLNLRRHYLLTLRIEGADGTRFSAPLFNTRDVINIVNPGPGFDRRYSDRSWKNIPATAATWVVGLRASVLPRRGPVRLRLDYDLNPWAESLKPATAAVLGYRWNPE